MPATIGYQAGVESNQAILSYAAEAARGVVPAVAFQAIRYTGESLAGTKTRTRPGEILSTGEVAAAITTQESAGGGLNFALSYGTFDDLLAGALNNDWTAPLVIQGAAGNIAMVAGAPGVSRGLATGGGALTGIQIGMWIKVTGFANAANNGIFRVNAIDSSTNTNAVSWIANTTAIAETPAGAAVKIRASVLRNSTMFKSFTLQQQFSPSLYLRYAGAYASGMTLTGGTGQFLNGSFTFLAQSEAQSTVNASTGGVLAAPVGRVHDPVGGFNGVYLDGQPLAATVSSFMISTQDTGAIQEFAMGQATAQGIVMGLLEAKGNIKVYFKDFALYTRFKAETQGAFSFATSDSAGNTYVITLNTANIINPKIDAGGPNQPVMATFDLEGNPGANATLPTIQIDRLPA